MSNIIFHVKSLKETTAVRVLLNTYELRKKNTLRQTEGPVTEGSHAHNTLKRLKINLKHINTKPKYRLNVCPQVLPSGSSAVGFSIALHR